MDSGLILFLAVNVADALLDDLGPVNLSTKAIPLDWISLVISLIINALATFLIGLKAWCVHYHDQIEIFKVVISCINSGIYTKIYITSMQDTFS